VTMAEDVIASLLALGAVLAGCWLLMNGGV
jgi:hypothetical protein